MKNIHHIISAAESSLMVPLCLTMISGCTHKDLNDTPDFIGNPLVTIKYDWHDEFGDLPEGMANLFYLSGSSSGSYWRSDFRPEGGTVRMPTAEYNAVTFNNDTENVLFSNIDSFSDFTFSTALIDTGDIPDDQLPFPPQRIFRQPDKMWCCSKKFIEIQASTMRDTVVFNPRRITRDFHIEMTEIENLQSALQYFSVLSDMSASYRPSTMIQEGPAVSMGAFMTPRDQSTISSSIRSFGMSRESSQARLAVYLWLADGQHRVYHYDVTDQILQAPDSMNVMIRVKGPSLPYIKPGEGGGGSGGGLDVGVDDWDIIDIEL